MKRTLIVLLTLLLTSCSIQLPSTTSEQVTSNTSITTSSVTSENDPLIIENMYLNVYGDENQISIINKQENETFTYEFEGDAIRIENDEVIAVRGGNEVQVEVTSSKGRKGSFTVEVTNRKYVSTHQEVEESEGWFNDVTIDKVTNMSEEFANGIDISSLKQLYDNGQKFYDKNGNETSLLYILKDAGVNWIRLRLWNKPYDEYTNSKGELTRFEYGGGNCTKENMAWIAHEAKAAGLKVLLNFHYSDFWSDPGNQILPKDWVNISTVDGLADAIRSFTKETLEYFREKDALPDAVAIGNEISSGLLIHDPGTEVTTSASGGAPSYSADHTDRNNGLQGRLYINGTKDSNYNIREYLRAGIEGVNQVDPSIKKMVHYVRGLSDPNSSIKFANLVSDLGFDILGLSAYPALHYINPTTLRNGFNTISNSLPSNMKVAIAEISYGFTYEQDSWASNSFYASAGKGEQGPVSSYEVSPQGQANCIKDASEIIANLSNGFGVFYWEGAWTPTKKSGWADSASKVTWANQGLFSYNGKALGSLSVYNKMLGK